MDPCGQRSRSLVWLPGVLVDELSHAVDPAAPQLLVLVEQPSRHAQPLDVGADDLASPDAVLGDKPGPSRIATCFCTAAKLIG